MKFQKVLRKNHDFIVLTIDQFLEQHLADIHQRQFPVIIRQTGKLRELYQKEKAGVRSFRR